MLDDACDPKLAEDDISDDVLSQLTMRDNNDVGVSASSSSVTVTLDHSTTGPFTSMPADNPTDLPDEVLGRSSPLNSVPDHPAAKSSDEVAGSGTPQRLASKPPLPQRSGTLSPRDAMSRPRPTHRRSQSLQHFTPTAGIVPLSDRSSVGTENVPMAENNAPAQSTTENVQNTYEIFV